MTEQQGTTPQLERSTGAHHRTTRRRPARAAAFLTAALIGGLAGTVLTATTAAAAPCAVQEWSCIFTNVSSTPQNASADGTLDTQSSVLVGMDIAIPNDAAPGDVWTLVVTDDIYRFPDFSGLELKDEDGTVLATASGSGTQMQLTLAPAVALLQDASGSLNVFVRPNLAATPGEEHTLSLTIGGASIGPDDTYKIAAWGNTGIQIDAGATTVPPDELAIVTSTYWRVQGGQVQGARAVIIPEQDGVVPVCQGDNAPYLLWVTNDGGAPQIIPGVDGQERQRVTVEECDPVNGRLVVAVPADLPVPEGVTAVRFRNHHIVDRSQTAYTMTADITGVREGVTSTVRDSDTATSGELAGYAAGQLRNAAVTITKTALNTVPVAVGDTVTYEISVASAEQLRTAYDVVVTDTLPEGLEFISASDGASFDAGVITWPAGDLLAGESWTFTVQARALEATASAQEITNVAALTGRNIDCTPGSVDASICEDDAVVTVAHPGLLLDKHLLEIQDTNANSVIGDPDDTLVYGFTLTNIGNTELQTVTLQDDKLGIQGHECLTAPLPIGSSIECAPGTFSYVITPADAEAGEVRNVATATTPGAPPSTDEVTTPSSPAPVVPAVTPPTPIDPAPVSPTPASTTPAPVTPTVPAAVTPAPKQGLAHTGADGVLIAGGTAIALLAAGTIAVAIRRRRASADLEQ